MNISWISALILGDPRTLSHSSTTKNLQWSNLMAFFLANSESRPGVAMIICGVFSLSFNSLSLSSAG